ncbi:hypothetical protein [Microvirga pudoricolor]|uniref:hypothetical protein n=1 Tax=Microvirga pudoricolor TaxID=2778729 RepID=UPI00194F9B51|nr:hypothetical protein [Microvirga pudoricolor]MBM6592448.1 hypothetical protein [Microvirga pudoricolor]
MLRIMLTIAALVAAPALSIGQVHEAKLPDCYCRMEGRIFAEGESACMATPDGPRVAECGMAINVMSWVVTSRPCPVM